MSLSSLANALLVSDSSSSLSSPSLTNSAFEGSIPPENRKIESILLLDRFGGI